MNSNLKEKIKINISLYEYFDDRQLVYNLPRTADKCFLKNGCIGYTFGLRIEQTYIIKQSCAVLLVKFENNEYKKYTAFKAITEIYLDPKDNYKKFKSGLVHGQRFPNDFQEVLKELGVIRQTLFFVRKNEKMQGEGYYSLIVSSKSIQEVEESSKNILDDIFCEFKFKVVEDAYNG